MVEIKVVENSREAKGEKRRRKVLYRSENVILKVSNEST